MVTVDYQINSPEIYDAIRAVFFELIGKADAFGLPIDNISIFIRPNLAEILELGSHLTLAYPYTPSFDVPIVRSADIKEHKAGDGLRSDIMIYSPDWAEVE